MSGQRPTLDTVAKAAGVSRMTVSNAYNHPDQLSSATRQRVLDAAGRLGYAGPDPTAASLRLGRTNTVGVVITERLPYAFADPGLITILHGIATELSDAGNAMLLVPAYGAGSGTLIGQVMVDALVLCSLDADDPAVAAAQDRRVPLVCVGGARLAGVPRVGPDNRAAAASVARHLLDLHHRRFAVLTSADERQAGRPRALFTHRVDGFRDALLGSDVDADAVEVLCAGGNGRESGRECARELLSRPAPQRPTAVFAVTDILALGVLDAAAEAGLTVPGSLSVAGFDDITEAATSQPPLTTVAHDLFGQGRAAARAALRLVSGDAVRPRRIETELVQRASTSPPGRTGRP